MGMLFQFGALFTDQTVFENVAFPLREHTDLPDDLLRDLVLMKLNAVGLRGAAKLRISEISGGMARRVALARAIALDPEVVLYDEPTTGLDPIRSDVINELILKLQNQMRITSVVVTHDMASAFRVGDRIVMLHEGKLIFDGTPQEIQHTDEPIVKRFVLGEASDQELAAVRGNGNRHSA
jgi:phospholipid/cholesterol/gamma-HCH transport system ATP-binding protein